MDHVNDLVALKFLKLKTFASCPRISTQVIARRAVFPNVTSLFRGSDDHWVEVVVTELTRDVPWNARVEIEDGAHDRNDLFWRATNTGTKNLRPFTFGELQRFPPSR